MDGTALVICDGYFDTPVGKTAHGLVRGTDRYRVVGVIDSANAGRDAGEVLDGTPVGIPVYPNLEEATASLPEKPDYLVLGMATDGGVLPPDVRPALVEALRLGIDVDSGLHQRLGEDPELAAAAEAGGAVIRDIRRCKPFPELHFFEGKIEEVGALRVAVLGTDSAVGKRTTARLLMQELRLRAPGEPAARAAVDLALHDLWAKRRGVSVQTLLGGSARGIPTSITIGISSVEETCAAAAQHLAQGFEILKIRGGRDSEEDIARVRAVRRASGPDVTIRLDANQGYSVDQARVVMGALTGEIEFLEQPVDAGDLGGLAALAAEAVLPVMADEPVLGPDEAQRVMRRGLRLVCVKLMKSGGLSEALRVCDIAQQHGARVMIGCMDELPISMAGAAHLALAHPAVAYADLDGHIGMVQRVATGGLEIRGGRVYVTTTPGLGVQVDEQQLGEFRVF